MSREAVKAIETLSHKKVFMFTPSSSAVMVLKGKDLINRTLSNALR